MCSLCERGCGHGLVVVCALGHGLGSLCFFSCLCALWLPQEAWFSVFSLLCGQRSWCLQAHACLSLLRRKGCVLWLAGVMLLLTSKSTHRRHPVAGHAAVPRGMRALGQRASDKMYYH